MDPGTAINPHMMLAIHVVVTAIVVLEVFSVVTYWIGFSWARWLIIAGCIFYLVGLRSVHADFVHSHFIAAMDALQGALAVFLLWYLHTMPVRAWFARRNLPASYK